MLLHHRKFEYCIQTGFFFYCCLHYPTSCAGDMALHRHTNILLTLKYSQCELQ